MALMRPMLATRGTHVPTGEEWQHEVKWDGMRVLVEAHSGDEVSRGLDAGARILGVNARDLTDFSLDRDLFGSLADRIPDGVVRVAESAVTGPADVAHYRRAGADVVLVGEALVTGADPAAALASFLDA